MPRVAPLALAFTLGPLASGLAAQTLTIVPAKTPGIYAVGEKIGWTVAVPEGQTVASATYTLKKNGLTVYKTDAVDLSSGKATIETSLEEPGSVLLEVQPPPPPAGAAGETPATPPARGGGGRGGRPRAVSGALVAPQKLQPSSPRPADFDTWWAAKIEQLHAIPMQAQLTPAESGKPGVDYALIQMDNINGEHIQGQLAKPAGGGKHPALLILQWAGVYGLPATRVTDRAAEGWLALNIEAHDIPPNRDAAFYSNLGSTTLRNYWAIGQDDREKSYFLRMYLSAYRALDYLTARDDWDGKILVVQGNSMGGQQTIAMAGLHPKVTAMIAEIPSSIDVTGPEHGSAAGFPDWARDAKSKNNPKILETAQYFDPMNFASRIKVPAFVAMGIYDETSPPVGIWRAINQMKGPVETLVMNTGHQEVRTNGTTNHAPYYARLSEWFAKLVKGEPLGK